MQPDTQNSQRTTWWRPFLTVAAFSLLPFAVFLNDNRGEAVLDLEMVLYALAVLVFGLLSICVASRLRGPAAREGAAVVFAAAAFVFFHFQLARDIAEFAGFSSDADAAALAAWLILIALALALVVRLSKHLATWNYAVIAGVLLLALPAVQYGHFKATASNATAAEGGLSDPRTAGWEPRARGARTAHPLPDVYFFLLDGYGRADQLEATLGFDNSRFLATLEGKGFTVHENATAAYSTTFLSLASTLEMGFPAAPGPVGDHRPFYEAIEGDNATVRRFHELGYRFALASDYSLFDCGPEVDLCVKPREDVIDALIGERERAILEGTPLAEVLPALGIEASPLRGYLAPDDAVDQIASQPSKRPVFAYSHILAPHPPYRYLEGCELKTDLGETSVTYWGEADGSGGEEYLRAIRCLNHSLLSAVRKIRARSDAIIVIQGDHGPKFGFDLSRPLSDWSKAELQQRLPILNAQLLPNGCSHAGPQAGFAANTFRYVLGCITGQEPAPLPHRYFTFDSERDRVERVKEAVLRPHGDVQG